MLLDLCRSRVLHTSTLGCFGRQLGFIVSFGREEIITLQLFCSIFMVNALDCWIQRLSTHMLQPITYSVRQAVNLLIDQSINFFSTACGDFILYISARSPCMKQMKRGKKNNPFSLPRYTWVWHISITLEANVGFYSSIYIISMA